MTALDSRAILRHGHRPEKGALPSRASFVSKRALFSRRIAVGEGWIAAGGATGWRPIATNDVQAVAVVHARTIWSLLNMRDVVAPGPYIVFRTQVSSVIKVDVKHVPAEARAKIVWQLPPDAQVTELADNFLRQGDLPGRLARAIRVFGFRFGRKVP